MGPRLDPDTGLDYLAEVFLEVRAEVLAGQVKHGEASVTGGLPSHLDRLAILMEEVGEVANCLTYDGPHDQLRAELLQVAAVAAAFVVRLDFAADEVL